MLKLRIITIIIAFSLTACNTLTERQAHAPFSKDTIETDNIGSTTDASSISSRRDNNVAADPKVSTSQASSPAEFDDIWMRIRDQLELDHHDARKKVKSKLAWYARHQKYLDRVASRAKPYLYHIVNALEQRNMPLELALLPIVESAYDPFAYSRSHASGIWQFIPSTGKNYGLKQNWWYDGRRDILAATDAALNYLEKLNAEFDGNWLHALAAYNCGERRVARAIAHNKKAGKPTDFWSLSLPRETRNYVPSLLALADLLARSQDHGVNWQKIENKPYFSKVQVQQQIDLATAASMAGISLEDLYTLNPAFNRWASAPEGPHHLLIPRDVSQSFSNKLKKLPDSERITWKRHIIKRGENLGQIARDYHSNVSALKQINKLNSNLIREGHSLLIPTSKRPLQHYTLSQDSRRHKGLKKSKPGKSHLYVVRSGDTLWDISRHYGVSVRQLSAWNDLNAHSVLRPGKKLNLWLSENTKNTAQAIPVNYNAESEPVITYTVKKGDSLWLIARRFQTSVAQLGSLNNLDNKKYLHPGQKLLIRNTRTGISGA